MAKTIITPAESTEDAEPDFLTSMRHFKNITDCLFDIGSACSSLAADANHAASAIRDAIFPQYRVPTRDEVQAALVIIDRINHYFSSRLFRSEMDRAAVSADLLLGNLLREPDGDLVARNNASADATSEAL